MGSKIDLSNGGAYLFNYDAGDRPPGYEKILEDVIIDIARHLKGHTFIKEQRAELVVIGNDADNHIYVLNQPSDWALNKFSEENRHVHWERRRIGNQQITRVIVRNMYLTGKDSEILVAESAGATSRYDYAYLIPIFLRCDTQELGNLMDELMKLHLFKIGKSKLLSWLHQQYLAQ